MICYESAMAISYSCIAYRHKKRIIWIMKSRGSQITSQDIELMREQDISTTVCSMNKYYGVLPAFSVKTEVLPPKGYTRGARYSLKDCRVAVITANTRKIFKWPASERAWKSLYLVVQSLTLDAANKTLRKKKKRRNR